MNKSKIITVVLTLLSAIIIPLDFMIATKSVVGTTSNSPIIVLNAENKKDDIIEVSSTENSNDTQKITTRGNVTSRSGERKSLDSVSEEVASENVVTENIETTIQAEKDVIADNSITENTETTTPVVKEPVQSPVEKVEESKPSYEGVILEYSLAYNITSGHLTKSKGVVYYNGHKETYYSQRVLPGKGLKSLNNNGRHVANDGTVRDGDGYIAVACNYLAKGSKIMTSLGPGKVYDTGSMTGKWIDIYVNW